MRVGVEMIAKNRLKKNNPHLPVATINVGQKSSRIRLGQNQTSFKRPRVRFLPKANGYKTNPEIRTEAAAYFYKVKGTTSS